MSFEIDLSDKVVLVTGGTGGIGFSVVSEMLRAGARVAFCSPSQADCDATVERLGKTFSGELVLGVAADLNDRASLTNLVSAVQNRWGSIDALVCNAADFGTVGPLLGQDLDVFVRVLQNNVVHNFLLCREVLPDMIRRGSGSIVLMTSITGYTAMPNNVAYASSKAAIASLGRTLAAEHADRGVRVNCVAPGLIQTEASRGIWENESVGAAYVADKVPAGRIGQPDEIANLCVFLASDLSRYITAATLPVDGGRLGIGQVAGRSLPAEPSQPDKEG